ARGAAFLVAAGGEERRDCTHPPDESETSHRLRLLAITTVTQPPGGPKPFVTTPVLSPGRALRLVPAQHLAHRPPLVGNRVAHDSIRLTPLVVLGQVFGDGHALGCHEEQAVAVLVLLHFVAGADPAPLLRLGSRVRVEVAGTE